MGERRLICTKEAAAAFRVIVDTIARPSEKARAELLIAWDNDTDTSRPQSALSREERLEQLQRLSLYPVPSELQLPIKIEGDEASSEGRLSANATAAMKNIPNPGRAVFAAGWANGHTTVTCNSVAVKQLERDLENLPVLEDPWPSMWAFPTSRPLVGTPRPDSVRPRSRKVKPGTRHGDADARRDEPGQKSEPHTEVETP